MSGIPATSRFPELGEKDLKTLYGHAAIIRLQSGDRLVREGDSDEQVYLLLEGIVGVQKQLNGNTKEIVQIEQERGKGGVALFGEAQWPVSMVALEPTLLLSLSAFALSLSCHAGKPSEISTIGLLHDLGKSIRHLLRRQNRKLELLIDGLDPSLLGGLLLRNWNLPDRVWKSIEYQEYPRFAPPSSIPEAYLSNVALLYLAHLCFDNIWGKQKEMVSPFTREYFEILGVADIPILTIVKQRLIPTLMKNMDGFPAFFRDRMTEYIRKHMTA